MRTFFVSMLMILILGSTIAAEKKYGKKLTLKEKTKISTILEKPEAFKGKRVLVEGVVTAVCKMKGCWIQIGSEKEFDAIRFKVDDGVIVFPQDAQGRTALAEGVVSVTTVSAEDQIKEGQMHAKETGEKFDPATVTGPKVTVQIKGEGAVIR